MLTQWGEKLDKDNVLPEYPRPQMRRTSFINLNGLWDYAFTAAGERQPDKWDGKILVPFSPECELSGVGRVLSPDEYLWYRRDWAKPDFAEGDRVILHFGAVDQSCTVYINGLRAFRHRGGYLPFEFDATGFLSRDVNEISLSVRDVSDTSYHSRGKQRLKRGGIWYTPQSGIWQTVWAECIPHDCIRHLHITPDFDKACVNVRADTVGDSRAYAIFDGRQYQLPASIPVPDFEPWSPENPKLYDFTVTCGEDRVESYFAMRKFSVEADSEGVKRLFLNGRPYFHNGLLDQGYWSDGMYTAPSDEALIFDIQTAKDMGFNMLRKHIKIEPLRWYYHCDRLGMLVWQDMINGGGAYKLLTVSAPLFTHRHHSDRNYRRFARTDADGRAAYYTELSEIVRQLYNCPCIVMWVPFNEGWGQFDALDMANELKKLDPTRFIDHASGWQDQGYEEMKSRHIYFRPVKLKNDGRALALTEYGGYILAVDGHRWTDKVFGYRICRNSAALAHDYEKLMLGQVLPHIRKEGLTAAVYTQITDVEEELNGLMTYDREVLKIPEETLREINAALRFDA